MSNLVPTKDPRRGLPSASNMERYFHCNRSYLLEKQVPENERFTNEAAEAGDRIHFANETSDLSVLDSMTEQDLVERIREREEMIFNQWVDDHQIRDAEIRREERVWLLSNGIRACSAKLDFYAISPAKRMALIIDAKSGRKSVAPPVKNLQLRTAGVILAANYFLVGARVAIVQPLAKAQPSCDYSPDDIYNRGGAWDQLNEILRKVKDPDAKAVTGDWCTNCTAKHICEAAQEVVQSLAKLSGLKWATLAPAQKLDLWDRAKLAKKIVESIEQNIKAELTANPTAIPGLTKRPDSQVREITDAIGTYMVLQETFPELKPEELNVEFNKLASVSIGGLETLVRERRGGTRNEAIALVNKALVKQITWTPKSGSVVREKAP